MKDAYLISTSAIWENSLWKDAAMNTLRKKEEKDEIKQRLARGDGEITANMEMTTREQYWFLANI